MPFNKLSKGLTGVAGEYFVAGELSRLGYVASITLRNTRGIDILASNAIATKQVAIQVKTNQGNKPEWVLNKKAEAFYADNLFYVFVNLKGPVEQPDFYIVPSKVVAERPRGAEIGVALGVAVVYFMVFFRMIIPERNHLIEYSVVAVFIYEALAERSSGHVDRIRAIRG